MTPFDLTASPLDGTNLIEASAGTGKTYTITGLFLRLILEKHLPAEKILVVTYTISATTELKDRIRSKLQQTRRAFQTGNHRGDPLIRSFLDRFDDRSSALESIHDALVHFDTVPIFTIHGFCQRILLENAFETGNLFDTELVADQGVLWKQIAEDYWRIHVCNLPETLVRFVIEAVKGPDYFSNLLATALIPDIRVIPEAVRPELHHLDSFCRAFHRLSIRWPACRNEIAELLRTASLNGRIYGTTAPHPVFPDRTNRDEKIQVLIADMDRFVDERNTGFPLFRGFERLTATKLAEATTRKQPPPSHEIFDQCEVLAGLAAGLEDELARYLLFLKKDFFVFARRELEKQKQGKNIQFFDDLLTRLRQALLDAKSDELARVVQRKYRAALIDEFQDTDPVQYDIFTRLFSSESGILFLIGDPKQAIYGFRGADIFSYLKASHQVDRRYTLLKNYRSRPELIAAVNTLFTQTPRPFLFDGIPFEPVVSGIVQASGTRQDGVPFTLWYLIPKEGGLENKGDALERAAESTAAEISRLVSPLLGHGTARSQPNDIAVLVRTNRQARIVQAYLSDLKIPCVLYSSESIFDSHEAMEMAMVLAGIAEPGNDRRFRAALATDMIGVNADVLDCDGFGDARWDDRLSRFAQYHQVWKRHGFMRMFRVLLRQERVKERLAALPDGERRLTNVLHLSETIHRAALENRLGMTGLVKWLHEQQHAGVAKIEAHQLRLESDALAVKIVTIHKSKGLEYDIVFCPFAWEGIAPGKDGVLFHDTARDDRLTLDLVGTPGSDAWTRSHLEQLAERLRLLYVALTRAKNRCYLIWGRIKTADTSPLACLFHELDRSEGDPIAALKQKYSDMDSKQFLSDLKRLASRSGGTIRVRPLPLEAGVACVRRDTLTRSLSLKTRTMPVPAAWKIASYSSMATHTVSASDSERPDYDAVLESASDDEAPAACENDSVFAFPKGARAGLFFHDLIEHFDFSNPVEEARVAETLQAYGFDTKWRNTVSTVLKNLQNLRMRGGEQEFLLASVGNEKRRNEMEFYFPLNPVSPKTLQSIFTGHGAARIPENFAERIGSLTFRPAGGFMKGFIDMVFEHAGRFYLTDWKSNYLGEDIDQYDSKAMDRVMVSEYYILQYHLYTLALHQYLSFRLPGYDYASHFGGVFYIFLRGIDPEKGSDRGVYHDRPRWALVQSLGRALIPGFIS